MRELFEQYFGITTGGVNLLDSLRTLPSEQIETFRKAAEDLPENGRIFFAGNGGSYDNAALIAHLFRQSGIQAAVPGNPDDYLATAIEEGYGVIYADGLRRERLSSADIVVGLSGSGNSANILEALNYANSAGAAVFCMGGRDGGKMRGICGDDSSMICSNESMECIEDLHVFIALAILQSIRQSSPVEQSIAELAEKVSTFLSPDNIDLLAKAAHGIMQTAKETRFLFVLGVGYGASHFRADMIRGASNMLPLRGISAPELFSINSAEATANDDGLDFILAAGLRKFDPCERDYALLAELESRTEIYDQCRYILDKARTPYITVGKGRDLDLAVFEDHEMQCILSMLGHATSDVIRKTLLAGLNIRELEIDVDFPPQQKRLSFAGTEELEHDLRLQKVISNRETLTFCYGRAYAVSEK